MKIQNYYFTYGTEGHPFRGGWTKIEAPSRKIACMIFRALHPDKIEGILNCCSVYDTNEFLRTQMWREGNFGKHEQECVLMQYVHIPEVIE